MAHKVQHPVSAQASELGPCHYKVSVDVPAARVTEEIDHAIRAAARGVKVKGFRPGKAPLHVLKSMIGDDAVDHAREHLFEHVASEALAKCELQALRILDFDPSEYEVEENQPLAFEFEVESAPQVELTPVEELEIEAQPTEARDEQIQQALQSLGMEHAQFEPAEGKALDEEHLMVCDLLYRKDGEDGPTAEGLRLGISSPLYGVDPESWPALVSGVEAGAEKTFPITFNEGFEKPEWVGAEGEAVLTVQEIVKPRPASEDEIAAAVKLEGGAEELREKIVEQIGVQNEREEKGRQVFEALDSMARLQPFQLPARLVDEEVEASVEQAVERLKQQGMPEDEAKTKAEEAREQLSKDADQRLRHYFLVRKIASAEKIRVNSGDLDRAYQELGARHQADPKSVRAYYEENGMDGGLRSDILEGKVRTWLSRRLEKVLGASEKATVETAGGSD